MLLARELTERVIGLAIEVHRLTGPGMLESVYEGSYGGFLVKRIVSDGSSFSDLSACHVRCSIDHAGRPLWSDLSVCKLVSGGTRCSVPCCPIRGAGGVWGTGPILTAACCSHSPGMVHRPPRWLSGVRWRSPSACFSVCVQCACPHLYPLPSAFRRLRRSVRRLAAHRSRRSATAPPAACGRAPPP